MALIDLANPTRFLSLSATLLPWLAAATALAFAYGFWLAASAPDDYQQGATVKIMFIHVPSAWLAMFGWTVMTLCRARHAGMASSACRCGRQGRGPDRRRLHADLPDHRLALGPPDVGHLLGLGRAADIRIRAVPDVSRRDRAMAHHRRSDAGRTGGRDPDTGRRDQHSDHQVFGRMVEYAASAGVGGADGRPCHSLRASCCRCW